MANISASLTDAELRIVEEIRNSYETKPGDTYIVRQALVLLHFKRCVEKQLEGANDD